MITLGKKLFGDHHVVDIVSKQERENGILIRTWHLAILVREHPVSPFVVCEFMEGDREWLQGHYRSTLLDALQVHLDMATIKGYA